MASHFSLRDQRKVTRYQAKSDLILRYKTKRTTPAQNIFIKEIKRSRGYQP